MRALPPADLPPPSVTRPADLVAAVRRQSQALLGTGGAAFRAWQWALSGTCPAPVTGGPARGYPPSQDEMVTEAKTAGAEVVPPYEQIIDAYPQVTAARRILEWLSGNSDEIPLPGGDRGRFVGARGDYARTDGQIEAVLAWARFGLRLRGLPEPMDPAAAMQPWAWDSSLMDAAWLRGVRDMLAWVAGEHQPGPLSRRDIRLPSLTEAAAEYGLAHDVRDQGRPSGQPVQPGTYPPPQYGEAIQSVYDWLRGTLTEPPADRHGHGAYSGCRERDTPCTCAPADRCTGAECPACAHSLCVLSQGMI